MGKTEEVHTGNSEKNNRCTREAGLNTSALGAELNAGSLGAELNAVRETDLNTGKRTERTGMGAALNADVKGAGSLNSLIDIIQTLRGENGCPWDRKQTPQTMWKCLAEEMYELLEAIENGDSEEICDELGDVLFQLLFIAEIYRGKGSFDIDQSIAGSAAKMIRRHPHIYGDKELNNEQELWNLWERIKQDEKKEKDRAGGADRKEQASLLDSVPLGMPALMRAYKVSERAVRAGFDWKGMEELLAKASEEWEEFSRALETGSQNEINMEFGDVLFTLTNVAHLAGVHPEVALAASTGKFEKRFRYMEQQLSERGASLTERGASSSERGTSSSERGASSSERGSSSTERGTSSTERGCSLSERGYSLKDVPRHELENLWDKAKESV